MRVVLLCGVFAASALAVAGCNKSSAVAPAGQAGGASATAFAPPAGGGSGGEDAREAPVPQVDGKPMWAANRKHTAEENARFQFAKNGGDFDAKTESAYVLAVHHFVEKPPRGSETLERSNGDTLIYDPKTNVFAVVTRDGAPRTMFKPRDGAAYWTQQKEREEKRSKGGGDSSGHGDSGSQG